ncbi:unnamed protein product [Timema podura]|uniref:Uncharacterized protein n=1 Tax=Timema podura TaxID=61482 RepID=A0ABN7NMP4_TIMPD|nr:unnamed protein product [Timema podura]
MSKRLQLFPVFFYETPLTKCSVGLNSYNSHRRCKFSYYGYRRSYQTKPRRRHSCENHRVNESMDVFETCFSSVLSRRACAKDAPGSTLGESSFEVYPHLRRESGKASWKNQLQYTRPESNHDLPVIGSIVYCESSALDHATPKAALYCTLSVTRPDDGVIRRNMSSLSQELQQTFKKRNQNFR